MKGNILSSYIEAERKRREIKSSVWLRTWRFGTFRLLSVYLLLNSVLLRNTSIWTLRVLCHGNRGFVTAAEWLLKPGSVATETRQKSIAMPVQAANPGLKQVRNSSFFFHPAIKSPETDQGSKSVTLGMSLSWTNHLIPPHFTICCLTYKHMHTPAYCQPFLAIIRNTKMIRQFWFASPAVLSTNQDKQTRATPPRKSCQPSPGKQIWGCT